MEKLGDLLLKEGLISQDQLSQALEIQKKERDLARKKLAKSLLDENFLTLRDIAEIARAVGYESQLLPRLAEEKTSG